MTAAVILDGIFSSFAVAPGKTIGEALRGPLIATTLIQLPLMEGWLWLAWLRCWLANPCRSPAAQKAAARWPGANALSVSGSAGKSI